MHHQAPHERARGYGQRTLFQAVYDDGDDDAYEVESIDANTGTNKDLSFHRGMLTPAELRLVAEWLDTGAHYFNDTDKYALPPQ